MKSEHNFIVILIICCLFGIMGIHRFVVGRWLTGILMILSNFIGLGVIWWIVDLVLISTGKFTDLGGCKVLPDP